MAYGAINFIARDVRGEVDTGATFYVYDRGTTNQVNVFPNSDGSGGAISQPISVGSDGRGYGFVNRDARRVDVAYTIDGVAYTQPVDVIPGDPSAGWVTATLLNSWANAVGYPIASYRRLETGLVLVRGVVQSGTAGTVFTLPTGYRPASQLIFPAFTFSYPDSRIDITTAGNVTLTGTYSTALADLHSIRFYAEA